MHDFICFSSDNLQLGEMSSRNIPFIQTEIISWYHQFIHCEAKNFWKEIELSGCLETRAHEIWEVKYCHSFKQFGDCWMKLFVIHLSNKHWWVLAIIYDLFPVEFGV